MRKILLPVLKTFALGLGLGVGLGLCLGAAQRPAPGGPEVASFETVNARRVNIVDERGEVRAMFGFTLAKGGEPALFISSGEGSRKPAVGLSVKEGRPSLTLAGPDRSSAQIRIDGPGRPVVEVLGNDGAILGRLPAR